MKRSRSIAVLATVSALALGGALWMFQKSYFRQAPPDFAPPYPALNPNGDPILGAFEGRTPCAECQTVKMLLALYASRETNEPSTYWLGRVHVGASNDLVVTKGTWARRRGTKEYPDAVLYELDSSTPEDLRLYWRVNENILLPLDRDENLKVGNASWGYMLSRTR